MMFAQITDCHIKAQRRPAYAKVDTATRLEALVAHVNAFRPRLDCVMVSGDGVDFGQSEEYALLQQLLQPLEMPYYLIPGNHDHRDRLREAFADHQYLKTASGYACYAIEDYPLRLIGLDTTTPGRSDGLLCETRLAWLDQCLAARPDQPTLIFMHHPPFDTGIGHMDAIQFQQADALFAVLARHQQVLHIACGHVHRDVHTVINGIGVSIAPNAAHAITLDLHPGAPSTFMLEPPAMRLFQYRGARHLVSYLSYLGTHDGPHPIFDANGQLID
ncbi:MAG TPA: serine/threonine protein phosphatase [Gammaproteobacteria bacterium]|jgi:3',5'-cyclic AMP phosphodiesterase CpdA|nr:serine/threonine protein phosphatase [Gammaproteobacteria bacterium]